MSASAPGHRRRSPSTARRSRTTSRPTTHRMILTEPLRAHRAPPRSTTSTPRIDGGGVTGQAGALRLGIARALDRARPRAAPRAQEGRLPHARLPREGVARSTASRRPARLRSTRSAESAAAAGVRHDVRAAFGTDGVRGVANTELTPELVARARPRPRRGCSAAAAFVIGRDTRVSGPAARGGARRRARRRGRRRRRSLGVRAHAGRGLARRRRRHAPAPMISASHNPFADNGVKLFAPGRPQAVRRRSRPRLEAELARLLRRRGRRRRRPAPPSARSSTAPAEPSSATATRVGAASLDGRAPRRPARRGRLRQRRRRRGRARACCARSAPTSRCSTPRPTARNINDGCGSTHPERPAARGRRRTAPTSGSPSTATPTGCSPSTRAARLVDGDQLIAICAIDRHERGRLRRRHRRRHRDDQPRLPPRHGASTASRCVESPVGDRYVLEALDAGGLVARRRADRATSSSATSPPPATACSPACSCSTSWPAPAGRWPSWPPPP